MAAVTMKKLTSLMKGKLIFYASLIIALPISSMSTPTQHTWLSIERQIFDEIKAQESILSPLEIRPSSREVLVKVYEQDIPKLSHFIHHRFKRCGGFVTLGQSPHFLSENQTQLKTKMGLQKVLTSTINYEINQETRVREWFEQVQATNMEETIIHLSSYKTRYYKAPEGVESMQWIAAKWTALTQSRSDISLELYDHKKYPQPTVILTIKGKKTTDRDLGPVIILGGHGDSINTDDEGIHSHAPGADDNAAGIALLTEIIRLIVQNNYAPTHTIQFIAYAAEEVGIQGSYHLAGLYRHERKIDVRGVMQFDGVNYKGQTYDLALVGDNTNEAQNNFVASLIDTYIQAKWRYEYCGYACSDHAAWNYQGYIASYPVEAIASESNPHFHTAEDTFDKSNYSAEHAVMFTKLGIAYLLELDN